MHGMDTELPLDVMESLLPLAEKAARDALAAGNMDAHFTYGRAYHSLADSIAAATGEDPRPTN